MRRLSREGKDSGGEVVWNTEDGHRNINGHDDDDDDDDLNGGNDSRRAVVCNTED